MKYTQQDFFDFWANESNENTEAVARARLEMEEDDFMLSDYNEDVVSDEWQRQQSYDSYALLETAWGIIANAGGGDWTKETKDWQEAATDWRELYIEWLSG